MCLQYAQLETKLGEIDRARAVYSHGSQFSDPRVCNVMLYTIIDVVSCRLLKVTGKNGKILKFVMAMKIHLGKC